MRGALLRRRVDGAVVAAAHQQRRAVDVLHRTRFSVEALHRRVELSNRVLEEVKAGSHGPGTGSTIRYRPLRDHKKRTARSRSSSGCGRPAGQLALVQRCPKGTGARNLVRGSRNSVGAHLPYAARLRSRCRACSLSLRCPIRAFGALRGLGAVC